MSDFDPKGSFNKDGLEGTLKHYQMKKSEFQGNFYIGKVVNNLDSEKLGRCQVLIYGFYDDIPDSDLPWACPTFGFNGEFVVPINGSIVTCYFQNGDIYNPHYTTKAMNKNDVSTNREDDYPNTWILWDDNNGTYKLINKKTNEIRENHISGFEFSVNKNGSVTIDASSTKTGEIKILGRSAAIKIGSDGKISIGDGNESIDPTKGSVNGSGKDPFTGLTYLLLGNASTSVFTK